MPPSRYVVYITIYKGNRLPPFYIGKTTEARVLKGYNGSVTSDRYKAIWRQERREYPDLFKTVIISRFDTDEEALVREEFLQRFFDVPNNPMFINMAISRGRFGDSGANNGMFGRHPSEEMGEANRAAHSGKIQSLTTIEKRVSKFRGRKKAPLSEELKEKIRKSQPYFGKPLPDEVILSMREAKARSAYVFTADHRRKIGEANSRRGKKKDLI